jgi:uncharacterized membrane protein
MGNISDNPLAIGLIAIGGLLLLFVALPVLVAILSAIVKLVVAGLPFAIVAFIIFIVINLISKGRTGP